MIGGRGLAEGGADHDLTVLLPRMREAGIPEDATEDVVVNYPERLFTMEV